MRKVGSVIALVGLVVVPPWALRAWGFYRFDSLNPWMPLDPRFLLATLTLVGWLLWLTVVAALVLEIAALVSGGRFRPRVPGLNVPRALVGSLLTVAFAAPSTIAMAAPQSAIPVAVSASMSAPSQQGPTATTATTAATSAVTHVVEPGDDLWSLAERFYGSGASWRRIVDANPSLREGDPVADLRIGTPLTIEGATGSHVVTAGDTLWHLADEHLGDGSRYPELASLNHLADPNELAVGTRVCFPTSSGDAGAAAQPTATPAAYPTRADSATTHGPAAVAPAVGPATTTAPAHAAASPAPTASAASSSPSASPTSVPPAPASQATDGRHDRGAVLATMGGLGALTAAGILGRVAWSRRSRAADRDLGRTFVPGDSGLQRLETALAIAASDDGPGREDLVDKALRQLAATWHASQEGVPSLRRVLVGDVLSFTFDEPHGTLPPAFLSVDACTASVAWHVLRDADRPASPAAYPALVTLGRSGDDLVMIDLAECGVLAIDGTADRAEGSVAAMVVELGCAPWAAGLDVWVVTDDPAFVEVVTSGGSRCFDNAADAVAELERCARERAGLSALESVPYNRLRIDPDRSDAWSPVIFLFERTPSESLIDRIRVALGGPARGLGAVLGNVGQDAGTVLRMDEGDREGATLFPGHLPLTAQTIGPDTRASLAALATNASAEDTIDASWWDEFAAEHAPAFADPADEEPDAASPTPRRALTILESPSDAEDDPSAEVGQDGLLDGGDAIDVDLPVEAPRYVATLPILAVPKPTLRATLPVPSGPQESPGPVDLAMASEVGVAARTPAPTEAPASQTVLRLLGPVTLDNAHGTPPAKAQRRCLEYCAWLLEHPGATASEMGRALFVTDGTRRSNLSRLRTWLGTDADGRAHLPEAYTGRITIEGVGTDWQRFAELVAPGVNAADAHHLREALSLVRGAPLADTAVGEWAWAADLRRQMCEAVRDAAVILARTCIAVDDLETARWAVERGELAAPDDELLGCELMRIQAALDDLEGVRATMSRLTRAASTLGRDLRDDTVTLSQRLLEGGERRVLEEAS